MGDVEDLFEGPASGLPALLSNKAVLNRGTAQYQLAVEEEAPVKHLAGYAAFVVFCELRGVPAGRLATDFTALLAFLRANIGDISANFGMSEAATIFVGNVIAAMRPEAHWRVMPDGSREVGARGMMITVDRLMDGLGEADDGMVAGLLKHLSEWAADEPDGPVLPELRPVPTGQAPVPFVRPELTPRDYRDADGQAIDYGNRWGTGSPPENSYSVETHGERFEGLHEVAPGFDRVPGQRVRRRCQLGSGPRGGSVPEHRRGNRRRGPDTPGPACGSIDVRVDQSPAGGGPCRCPPRLSFSHLRL